MAAVRTRSPVTATITHPDPVSQTEPFEPPMNETAKLRVNECAAVSVESAPMEQVRPSLNLYTPMNLDTRWTLDAPGNLGNMDSLGKPGPPSGLCCVFKS